MIISLENEPERVGIARNVVGFVREQDRDSSENVDACSSWLSFPFFHDKAANLITLNSPTPAEM